MAIEKKKKRSRKEPSQAESVLQSIFEKGKSPLANEFQRYRLRLNWAEVVGPTIGKACYPYALIEGKLYLCAKNSSWLNELYYAKKQIVEKVNKHLGNSLVREVRVTLDSPDAPKKDTRP